MIFFTQVHICPAKNTPEPLTRQYQMALFWPSWWVTLLYKQACPSQTFLLERCMHRCIHFMLWNFKQPKYRTLQKTSVQETQSVWSHVPYLLRNVHCGLQRKSTLSSFGVRKYRKVTQVYFYWPGLSFTSWIQIVIMTNADDASFLSSTGGKSWK